jgi:hypothetical protein
VSYKNWVRLTAKEHIAAFILASVADIQLLVIVSQLAARAGLPFDFVRLVGVHEVLLTILIFGVTSSSIASRGWRWQYVASSVVFSGYVGYRMATRFISALELVAPLQSKGFGVSGYLGFFYVLALASAITYVLMILVLRRAYGKLVSVRSLVRDGVPPQPAL